MKIKDIPDTLQGLMDFKKVSVIIIVFGLFTYISSQQYEQKAVRYSPCNWKVATPTLNLLYSRAPSFMKPLIRATVPVLLEELDRHAFGIEEPNWVIGKLFFATVRLRAFIIRHLMLPRRKFWTRTPWQADDKTGKYMPTFCIYGTVYPDGYVIPELGPEKFAPKCPVMHS